MSSPQGKDRFLRIFPGRLRIEVAGLQGNKSAAELLGKDLSSCKGVSTWIPCTVSGRLLVVYDQKQIDVQQIFSLIRSIEQRLCSQGGSIDADQHTQPQPVEARREVAAAAVVEPELPDDIRTLPVAVRKPSVERVPLPLALSIGGLALLGAKQLIWGRSALARSPAPFYLSALIAVVTGYPFLKRGIQSFGENKKINSDLALGASALALALIRENLVVLAGLSLLQFVNWQRSRSLLNGHQAAALTPEIQRYSENAGKWGMLGAGATWAITRDPLRAIAVLLAANPRPMTLPAQYAWNQAELVSGERHYVVPERGSLSQLARTKTMLLEDSSVLFDSTDTEEIQCIADNEEEGDKIVCLAASLMEKSTHPWKEDMRNKAKQTCRTIRTAFHVEQEEQGITGKINDNRVVLGSFRFLQEHGIDCASYELKAKRLARNGYDLLFAGKLENSGSACLGLLVRHRRDSLNENGAGATALVQHGWRIGLLRNSIHINDATLAEYQLDTSWLTSEQGEVIERVAAMRHRGEEVLFVSAAEHNAFNEFFIESGIPTVPIGELKHIEETASFAQTIARTVNQHAEITKKWNIVGASLATLGMLSAPIVNLAGDALSLVFMSRTKKISESMPLNKQQVEVAAASEADLWHALPSEQVLGRFQVSPHRGLTSAQAASAKNEYGANRLDIKKPIPWFVSYFAQFKEFTTLILLSTTALALFTGGLFDGIAMGGILLANAAIGTIQERKAEKIVETLNQFQPFLCKSVRDGQLIDISATELVPGDIVLVEPGDRVPADIRLLSCSNLRINEATLTGESLPVEKKEHALIEDCTLSERNNMLYMGTDVCGGKGTGIVVHTGMKTEMGHLMSLFKKQEKEVTPLQEKVTSISKKFVKGALVAGGLVFLAGLMRGIPVTQMITTSITLAASAIPEGLPVTITIALSAGLFRMAKRNALIRKLSSLETLGRTTVICTDKTGTLTKNEMTVKALSTIDRVWSVTGNGYEPSGTLMELTPEVAASSAVCYETEEHARFTSNPDLKRILEICLLCNNSKLEQQEGQWLTKGDPTEGALLTLAAKNGLWPKDMTQWHRGREIPFDSNTAKMSVVCNEVQPGRDCYVFSKGAVETIVRHCNRYQKNGQVFNLSDEQKHHILQQNEKFSADALRVLAFAYRPVEESSSDEGIDEKEMIYLGMAGMIDPPKPEVEQSVREAVELGVKPVMITGDHPITAIAIAKQLGIYNEGQRVLSGHELDRMTDDELIDIVDYVSVFARVTPEHKLRIVTAFQKRGHIVAMTGDGVNDTPAIKQSNVGIAMGQTGTEVTKETADMVLTEDHFGTIVEGVKEGRTIIGNIRKAIGCLLTGNLAEIALTCAAVLAGLPIPLVPIQILLMNLLTDALPAMVLAVNPGNKLKQTKRMDIVDKRLYQKVIVRGLLLGLGSLGLYAFSLSAGVPFAVAQSTAFATLVAGQLIQTLSWRQEGSDETVGDWMKDRFLLGALGVSWAALLAVLYVPALAGFFHTAPLNLTQWIPILAVAGSVSVLSKPVLSLLSKKQQDAALQPVNKYAYAAVS